MVIESVCRLSNVAVHIMLLAALESIIVGSEVKVSTYLFGWACLVLASKDWEYNCFSYRITCCEHC